MKCDTGTGDNGNNSNGDAICDSNASAPGYQLYVSKITYTGNDQAEGRYSVIFNRDSIRRPDIHG